MSPTTRQLGLGYPATVLQVRVLALMFQCIVVDMLISIGAFLEGATDEAAYATYLENLEEKLRRRTSHMDAEESPRQEAAAGDSEEVPFPDTKLAKKFLQQRAKAKKENDKNSQYEEAYVQIMVWLFEHSKSLVNSADCPHAMDTQLVIQTLEASPPQNNIQPDLFGYASWKELVEEEWDPDHKGYVARPDINRFWGKFNVRHAFMKNRKVRVFLYSQLFPFLDTLLKVIFSSPWLLRRWAASGTK